MKRAVLILLLASVIINAHCQVSEGRSGLKTLNISRAGKESSNTAKEEASIPTDVTPPNISVTSPDLSNEAAGKSNSGTLLVKGRAEDKGGIFEVLVNGINAKVAFDGSFIAEIPLSIGQNPVTVRATDVSLNRSSFTFIFERIPEAAVMQPTKPINKYSITFKSPASDAYLTASDKLTIQACIKASAPVKKIMISRNGTFLNGYLSNNIVPKEDCSFMIDEPVLLKLGINDLKIEVFAEDDTISKSVTIEYSLYAARNYALLIGNQKYNDPEINELEEPVSDVEQLYEVLTTEYNFDPANVTKLNNCNKSEIIGKLHELRSRILPTDNLLIFYAGHGFWDEGMGVGYWLPKDAAKNNPVNWIPNTDLTNYLGAIKAKHTLLIADACFSGGIFKTRSAFSASYAIEMLYQLNSRKAITSGTLTEVPDRSVFFQYLLKNLKENSNDYLSSEELFSKMRMAVINNSENVPQFGTIQNVGDEGGDFIFIKRKK